MLKNNYRNVWDTQASKRSLLPVAMLVAAALISITGCSRARDVPPEGRCYDNSDCGQGFRCKDGWCEDIYHPQGKVKQGL